MKKFILPAMVACALVFTSCGSDDDNDGGGDDDCQTCAEYTIEGITFPEQEVCEGENGNAFVAGQDTMQTFSDFIGILELVTTCE